MKTYMAKAADQGQREWYLVDASGQTLGRLAAKLAKVLQGKHKPTYTPHIDMGDFVVVINADKVHLSGNKRQTKTYPYYTGWRGGYKERTFEGMLEKDPGWIIKTAVRRMLPKTTLGRAMLRKLKAYGGSEHPHGAQNPKPLDLEKI
ncbi:MAG: 50S ribosomal protein L13 [Planctomycetota bacterium]|nr:MAG: 50S ribosomal protein L13 [Planctomycetota bacterium]